MYIDNNNNNSGSSVHTTHVVSLATTASSPSSSSDVWSSWAARLLLLLVLLCHTYALTSRWRGHARRVCGMCAICMAALCVVVAVVLAALYCLDAFALLAQLRHIVTAPDTSLTTAAGLAVVSRRVRALAQTRQTQQRRQQAPPQLLLLLALVYVTLQALCVPGTLVLNVVAGALVGVRVALPLCVALGTAGAVACYALSRCVGARLVAYVDARRTGGRGVAALRARVAQHRRELFVYMLFLRLTPVLPNGLVNVASPIAHVPLSTFAAATAVGIAPQTYLAVRFGALAHTLQQQQQQQQEERGLDDNSSSNTLHVTTTTTTRIMTATDTLLLAVLGATCVLVVHLKRRFAT